MRVPRLPSAALALAASVALVSVSDVAGARDRKGKMVAPRSKADVKEPGAVKPWCAPDVVALSDHVCSFDGGPSKDGRRTLVIYLHGVYAESPGFAWLQQRAMAFHAKRLGFTVLLPTAPKAQVGFVWPTSQASQEEHEAAIVAGIKRGRAELEKRAGKSFDETFVIGFSSGAYYASSLAVRGALDVDGYMVLAGGSSWVKPGSAATEKRRAPVFVGVSAADSQTASHSRSFAGSLAAMHWPFKVEERNAGHLVDWTFMEHGMAWLRAQSGAKIANAADRSTP